MGNPGKLSQAVGDSESGSTMWITHGATPAPDWTRGLVRAALLKSRFPEVCHRNVFGAEKTEPQTVMVSVGISSAPCAG